MNLKSSLFSACFVLVVMGVPATASAYHVNTTEKGYPIRWGSDQVAMRIDPNYSAMLSEGQAITALDMAFEAWRGFPGVPDLLLKLEAPPTPGHHEGGPSNGVYLVQDWPYEPDKLAVTVVTYELSTGRLLDADVLVNSGVPFSVASEEHDEPDADSYDLAAVLTHESGHVLGLGETEADPMATMWPYARKGDTHQRTLEDDDEAGVIAAYAGSLPEPARGCGGSSVAGRPHAGAALLQVATLALLLLFVARGALRQPRRPARLSLIAGLGVLVSAGPSLAPEPVDATPSVARETPAAHLHDGVLDVDDPRARPLVRALLDDALAPRLAVVEAGVATRRDGLLFTQYRVRHRDGSADTLVVPGGELDGIGQRVGEIERPVPGQELLIAQPSDGSKRWAVAAGDELHGGFLGHRRLKAKRPLDHLR